MNDLHGYHEKIKDFLKALGVPDVDDNNISEVRMTIKANQFVTVSVTREHFVNVNSIEAIQPVCKEFEWRLKSEDYRIPG